MDREILFRGKDADTGEWIYGGLFVEPAPPVCMGERIPDKVWIVFPDPRFTPDWGLPYRMLRANVDPATVGQYTGMNDKNNVKIFDGDIIRVYGNDDFQMIVRFGKYNKSVGKAYYFGVGVYLERIADSEYITPIDSNNNDVEVIGNIYDNSEFLEGR